MNEAIRILADVADEIREGIVGREDQFPGLCRVAGALDEAVGMNVATEARIAELEGALNAHVSQYGCHACSVNKTGENDDACKERECEIPAFLRVLGAGANDVQLDSRMVAPDVKEDEVKTPTGGQERAIEALGKAFQACAESGLVISDIDWVAL